MSQDFATFRPVRSRSGVWLSCALAFVLTLTFALTLTACGGGSGGGGDTPPPANTGGGDNNTGGGDNTGGGGNTPTGDDARRAVLKDIGEEIILPALRDFDSKAAALKTAADALALAPADTAARVAAQAAWDAAMTSWQRNELFQVGPAGRAENPDIVAAGQGFRDFIYSWPATFDPCDIEAAAQDGDTVDSNTPINIAGLGAIEYLLYTNAPAGSCAAQPDAAKRAAHVVKLASRVAIVATALRNRWEPTIGNFIAQWSEAGAGSQVYAHPQDALNALSVALFYAEKSSKDRKIAVVVGLPAVGLSCTNLTGCPELLESRLSRHSGKNLIANIQALRDAFTGLNGKHGMNDLLVGIGRSDIATEFATELNAVQAQLTTIENGQGFDTAVESITNRNDCVNAFASSIGLPPCALAGIIKTAMDTYRGPIISVLSLAIPDSAAGDND